MIVDREEACDLTVKRWYAVVRQMRTSMSYVQNVLLVPYQTWAVLSEDVGHGEG